MSKYCYNCGKVTDGDEPAFCNFCGKSYEWKLCPRQHKNPRRATVCSQCGSRDLSEPQPKIPVLWQMLGIVIRIGLGLLLFYTTLKLLEALLLTAAFQELLVVFGFVLAGLWLLWSKLPDWLQETLRWLWNRRNHED